MMTLGRSTGSARKAFGVALVGVALLLALILRFIPDSEWNEPLYVLAFVVQPAMLLTGAFLYWRGRQYAARAKAQEIISDGKPDVLYLRTFRTDPSTIRQVFSSFLTTQVASGFATEEEQLADVVRPIGDLVAIGQPGEYLPQPGAARIYATDQEWQDIVRRQMRAAKLVVIRAGLGENLLWELREAVSTVPPHRLLILFLNMKGKDYQAFRARAAETLPLRLPDPADVRRFRRVSGFVCFAPDWSPGFLRLRLPFFRRGFKPLRRSFQCTLRPVFESLGVPWKPPSVSALMVGLVSILGLVGAFVLFAIGASFVTGDRRASYSDGTRPPPAAEPNEAATVPPPAPAAAESTPSKEKFRSIEFLSKVAAEASKSAPKRIDSDTELRSVTAGDRAIIYNYALVNYAAAELVADKFVAAVRERIETAACRDQGLRTFWENGVSVHYAYAGKDGLPVATIVVTPERCGF